MLTARFCTHPRYDTEHQITQTFHTAGLAVSSNYIEISGRLRVSVIREVFSHLPSFFLIVFLSNLYFQYHAIPARADGGRPREEAQRRPCAI